MGKSAQLVSATTKRAKIMAALIIEMGFVAPWGQFICFNFGLLECANRKFVAS